MDKTNMEDKETLNANVNPETENTTDNQPAQQPDNEAQTEAEAEAQPEPSLEEQLKAALDRVAELEKDRLYRQAEFDNYRRNQMKEKADLILNGGRKVLESMLPVMDDMELALQHMTADSDLAAIREGVELIRKKFLQVLATQGVKPIETQGADFDTDLHEAIAQIPAPTEELKGKVLDCTKKGYTLNDHILRFAQVVVGN